MDALDDLRPGVVSCQSRTSPFVLLDSSCKRVDIVNGFIVVLVMLNADLQDVAVAEKSHCNCHAFESQHSHPLERGLRG